MLTSLPSPSPFGAHRLSGRDEQQLRWYWQASERELGGLSAEKGLPSYTESAEALADKIERSIWEATRPKAGP